MLALMPPQSWKLAFIVIWFCLPIAVFCQQPFITTWNATVNSIAIPTDASAGTDNYDIEWEEIGNEATNNGTATGIAGNYAINTANANQYRVKILGQFPKIYFNNGGDRGKILTVEQWGDIAWTNMEGAFFVVLQITSIDYLI